MIHINSIQAQGAGFNFQLIFLIFTPNIWKKTWTQLDMKAHIWFRMGYIGEFNVHQPVYMIQIYIYIFTTNILPPTNYPVLVREKVAPSPFSIDIEILRSPL